MDALERYILDHSTPEDQLLRELERETNLKTIQPRMISGHIQGKFLELLVRMSGAESILEIGTFTGYSALCFAAGLPEGGVVDTIEVDDELEMLAKSFFDRSEHGSKIVQHIGSALDLAPSLDKLFDIVFVDGDKREYVDYYKMIMGDEPYNKPLVKSGSYIIADNILWYGKVADPLKYNDLYTKGIVDFNDMVIKDSRVESFILPLRDGLNIIRVK